MSSNPFTSVGGIPGSAIAEHIFNDPDSWEENDPDSADVEDLTLDPLAWLHDEIEKFKANTAEVHGAFDPAVHGKRGPGLTTPPAGGEGLGTGLKGIDRTSSIRPISITSLFEPSLDEDIQDQLSKILDSGGIPHHVRPLSSAHFSPSSSKTVHTPLKINTASTVPSSTEDPSPVAKYPSSITLSFLEWYGIHVDSDLNLRSKRQQLRRSVNPKIPALKVPSPRHSMRSSSLGNPSPLSGTFSRPPGKRLSSISPPGLKPPPRLSRSQSPKPSTGVPSAPPPPYSRRLSPAGSRPNSRARSCTDPRSLSPTGASVQGMSNGDSNGTARRRRLPSIPPEPTAGPIPSLQIQVPTPAAASSRQASLPVRSSTAPPSTALSPPLTSQLTASRSLSMARSQLVGPAGPRTRTSPSRMSRQDATTPGASLARRPPALRL